MTTTTMGADPRLAGGVRERVGAQSMPGTRVNASESRLLSRMVRRPGGALGLVLLGLLLAAALLAPWLSWHDPVEMMAEHRFASPSAQHLLGGDEFGRDLWSRLLYGGRTALLVGAVSVACASVAGTLMGLLAGYRGGWLDTFLMRAFDVLLAFPVILLAIVITAVLGPGLMNAVLAVTVISVPVFARLARASVLVEAGKEYVEAARAVGVPQGRILVRGILPNIMGVLIVQVSVAFASAVLLESALSFLGLGVPLPAPSWGTMMSVGRGYMNYAPLYALAPGVALMMLVLGLYLTGDALRDALDPRQPRRF